MKNKKLLIVFALLILALIAFYFIFIVNDEDNNTLAYGNVNIKESNLSFQIQGRIDKIYVDEGQSVLKGSVLATLDTRDLEYKRAIEEKECKALEQNYLALKRGNRSDDIKKAQAYLDKVTQDLNLASLTFDRYQKLWSKRAISKQEYDTALYSKKALEAEYKRARSDYNLIKEGARKEDILKAYAQFKSCDINLLYLDYQIHEKSKIIAPFDGLVRIRYSQVSDMVGPNVVSFGFVDNKDKEISVYLASKTIDELFIKVGQGVKVIKNDAVIDGVISFISQSSMFTPKTVASENLRPDLVYEVKIKVKDLNNILRFGESVTVSLKN